MSDASPGYPLSGNLEDSLDLHTRQPAGHSGSHTVTPCHVTPRSHPEPSLQRGAEAAAQVSLETASIQQNSSFAKAEGAQKTDVHICPSVCGQAQAAPAGQFEGLRSSVWHSLSSFTPAVACIGIRANVHGKAMLNSVCSLRGIAKHGLELALQTQPTRLPESRTKV